MISVIVPCYNYGRYLTDALHSLVGGETCLSFPQGHCSPGQRGVGELEIVIVDDASTDESAQIGLKLAAALPGVSFTRNFENQGTAATYNAGIEATEGEFVTVLSADDMREPWALAALLRACGSAPGAVAYDDICDFADGQRVVVRRLPGYSREGVVRRNILHAGIMMPRAAWEEVGGYPEVMADGREEWAMGIALSLTGRPIVHVPRPGYLYRQEGQNRSLHNSGWDSTAAFLCTLVGLYPDAFREIEPRIRRGQTSRSDRFWKVVQRCLI
jgi:glycosyltransferase involved in cell wall biosynthesis